MDVVISQPELPQLTAEAALVCGPVPKEVHRAIEPPLEDLGQGGVRRSQKGRQTSYSTGDQASKQNRNQDSQNTGNLVP